MKKLITLSPEQAAAVQDIPNFSEYVRSLIRADMGDDVFPPDSGWGGKRQPSHASDDATTDEPEAL